MKLLLDSANLDEIEEVKDTSAVCGVTTNPSLMAKEEKCDYTEHILKICDLLVPEDHLSVEVITLDPEEMIDQADLLHDKVMKDHGYVDLHIKIPVSFDYLRECIIATSFAVPSYSFNYTLWERRLAAIFKPCVRLKQSHRTSMCSIAIYRPS